MSLFLSTVRIVDVKKVYDDGTITDFNASSTARRLLSRTQVGVEVDYYVTSPQSQALTQLLLLQNSTRAAMAKVLRSNQSNAVLYFPRFGDTVPPSFAPTPVPTVKPALLTYGALVAVCVVGGIIVFVGSIVLGMYGRQRHVKRKKWKIQQKLDTNSPDATSLGGGMDLEGGDHHDTFQRPRLFNDYNNEDEKIADDDMDKESSDLSSIALSVTEVLTPMISSGPSSVMIKSGEIIGVSSDKSGSGRGGSKGTGSSLDSDDPLVRVDHHSLARNTASVAGQQPSSNRESHLRPGHDQVQRDDESLDEDDLMNLNYYASARGASGAVEQIPATSGATSVLGRAAFAAILRAHTEHHELTSSAKEVERPPDLNIHDAFRG